MINRVLFPHGALSAAVLMLLPILVRLNIVETMKYCALSLLSLLLISGSCSSKGGSELSQALSGAVKEKKLSSKKMENILTEYAKLRDEDKTKAREYVDQVLSAIEMGGDSTHIDAARRQVMRRQGEKKV